MINKEKVQAWIDALRSGKYEQYKGTLRSCHGYCCLGVAQDLFGDWDDYDGDFETCYLLDTELNEELGLVTYGDLDLTKYPQSNINLTLADFNDKEGYTFSQIADYIEENILNKVN